MRDFDRLPLLTPEEAYERAVERGSIGRPLFDADYRVRDLNSWKTLETLLRQDDVPEIVIASFGLRRFSATIDAINMLKARGWHTWQTVAEVYVGGEFREVQALRARYGGD
uniref:Uncharacterized protein n=1 Tax=Dulem virus 38 TaxID=3145756 RepID=A0AAU8B319_9CAUD